MPYLPPHRLEFHLLLGNYTFCQKQWVDIILMLQQHHSGGCKCLREVEGGITSSSSSCFLSCFACLCVSSSPSLSGKLPVAECDTREQSGTVSIRFYHGGPEDSTLLYCFDLLMPWRVSVVSPVTEQRVELWSQKALGVVIIGVTAAS